MGKCAFFGENEKDYEKDYYRAAKYDIFIVEDDIICIFANDIYFHYGNSESTVVEIV